MGVGQSPYNFRIMFCQRYFGSVFTLDGWWANTPLPLCITSIIANDCIKKDGCLSPCSMCVGRHSSVLQVYWLSERYLNDDQNWQDTLSIWSVKPLMSHKISWYEPQFESQARPPLPLNHDQSEIHDFNPPIPSSTHYKCSLSQGQH